MFLGVQSHALHVGGAWMSLHVGVWQGLTVSLTAGAGGRESRCHAHLSRANGIG